MSVRVYIFLSLWFYWYISIFVYFVRLIVTTIFRRPIITIITVINRYHNRHSFPCVFCVIDNTYLTFGDRTYLLQSNSWPTRDLSDITHKNVDKLFSYYIFIFIQISQRLSICLTKPFEVINTIYKI